ncbi:MAG TPA: hypothetical protein VOA87_02440 [Thermoanaerobaculia bacterium]|nr:hypothetical protein [Thermoanaerobaculia bacterium]
MIRPIISIARPIAFLALVLLSACGGGGSGPTDSVFLPDISNNWVDASNSAHLFVFRDFQTKVEHSTFQGEEDDNNQGTSNPLSGAFNDREIHFTISRPTGAVTFEGQFTTPNRMELSSPAGALVLTVNR